MSKVHTIRSVLILLLLACLSPSCSAPKWHASVYLDRSLAPTVRDLGDFPTLEDCRRAAITYLSDLGALGRGDYECGKNCWSDTTVGDTKLYRCEETSH